MARERFDPDTTDVRVGSGISVSYYRRWSDGIEIEPTGITLKHNGRPLVVIDPQSREQADRLFRLWRDSLGGPTMGEQVDAMQAALREFASPTPPRPDEPAIWGVVEASCVHLDERRKWIRHDDGNWWPADRYGEVERRLAEGLDARLPDAWDDLVDPVLVREGVTQ